MRNAFKPNVCECNDCTFHKVAVTNHTKNKNATKRDHNKFMQAYIRFTRTPLFLPLLRKHLYTLPHKDALFIFIKPRCLHTREKEKRTI